MSSLTSCITHTITFHPKIPQPAWYFGGRALHEAATKAMEDSHLYRICGVLLWATGSAAVQKFQLCQELGGLLPLDAPAVGHTVGLSCLTLWKQWPSVSLSEVQNSLWITRQVQMQFLMENQEKDRHTSTAVKNHKNVPVQIKQHCWSIWGTPDI